MKTDLGEKLLSGFKLTGQSIVTCAYGDREPMGRDEGFARPKVPWSAGEGDVSVTYVDCKNCS